MQPYVFPGIAAFLESANVDPAYRNEAIADRLLTRASDLLGQAVQLDNLEAAEQVLEHAQDVAQVVYQRATALRAAVKEVRAGLVANEKSKPARLAATEAARVQALEEMQRRIEDEQAARASGPAFLMPKPEPGYEEFKLPPDSGLAPVDTEQAHPVPAGPEDF